jgi:hypothetical protein
MSNLKVWTNHTDTVIAVDVDDVKRVCTETYGAGEPFDPDEWKPRVDRPLTINFDDHPPDAPAKVTKTNAEWIASEGRGLLCSTEY